MFLKGTLRLGSMIGLDFYSKLLLFSKSLVIKWRLWAGLYLLGLLD